MYVPFLSLLQLTECLVLIDARTVPANKVIETDVCIVGAGAAGISLAREFIDRAFRVCLLESGGLEFDENTQSLYRGENIGLPYAPLEVARLRYFGGTTNHWEGWCRPLDPIDFEARKWLPYSGWPFDKSQLDPFYERAQSLCKLGPYKYDAKDSDAKKNLRLSFAGTRIIPVIFQFSAPIRFGQTYRGEIAGARNINTYLHANVVDIETTQTSRRVSRLQVACLQGNKFWVAAKLYILATGGIENARILLLSNKVQSAGLGNQHDLVGRFFMDHPYISSGLVLPSDSGVTETLNQSAFLSLAPETLRDEKLLNFCTQLKPTSWSELSAGFSSLRVIVRAFRRGRVPADFLQHLWNVIGDLDDVAVAGYRKLRKKRDVPMELLSVIARAEQAPNPDSRVTLSNELDALGRQRMRLNWQLSAIDKRSIRRAHEIIGQELGRAGVGRLKMMIDDDDKTRLPAAGQFHHMGTTRMHVDPKKGVVDTNCQVHGVSNLFIAGSSVFPTSGHAHPTLTVIALAVRLADHVKRVMG